MVHPPIVYPVGKSEGCRKIETFMEKAMLHISYPKDINFPTTLRFSDCCVSRLSFKVNWSHKFSFRECYVSEQVLPQSIKFSDEINEILF